MKKTCLLALMVLASAAAAGAADPDKSDDSKPAALDHKPKSDRNDPNKVICHTNQQTGSRTRVNRVCHTRAEWEELSRNMQKSINDLGRQENTGTQRTNSPIGL